MRILIRSGRGVPDDVEAETRASRGSLGGPRRRPLAAGIRRHLGQNLRALYADTLAAPLTQRLETLMAQLDKTKR
ncbi:NepR family anti-sigma factor [Methylobacterium mesophilicum]|uniref:NepR family anti-sigma factor n=1 Tax=Methylobacterium mesophilicum TaxID=39956 RepID=UPI001FCF169C|nr:NepR family anti-sigma factor [Methylobacterium mesophilicum]